MYMYRDTHTVPVNPDTCTCIGIHTVPVNPDTCTCIGIHTVPVKDQSMLPVPR